MYFSGMIVVVTLPFTLKLAGEYYSVAITQNYYKMLVVFAASSIFGIFILGQLRKMMKTVICDDCFVWQNVKSLELCQSAVLVFLFIYFKSIFCPNTGHIDYYSCIFSSQHFFVLYYPVFFARQSITKKKMILQFREVPYGNYH